VVVVVFVGRIFWLLRVRLGSPLGHGNFLAGLKLSGAEATRWRTQSVSCFGAVLGRLSVGRPYVRKWPFMARRYGVWQVLHVWA
jgi:hypothetical protein